MALQDEVAQLTAMQEAMAAQTKKIARLQYWHEQTDSLALSQKMSMGLVDWGGNGNFQIWSMTKLGNNHDKVVYVATYDKPKELEGAAADDEDAK